MTSSGRSRGRVVLFLIGLVFAWLSVGGSDVASATTTVRVPIYSYSYSYGSGPHLSARTSTPTTASGAASSRFAVSAAALAARSRLAAPAGVAAEGATSGLSIGEKIAGQMGPRGWSESLLRETLDSPAATHTVWDFTSGTRQAATAYARADGSYVVVNDATRAVVQVSDINKVGWKPVWDDPRFQR